MNKKITILIAFIAVGAWGLTTTDIFQKNFRPRVYWEKRVKECQAEVDADKISLKQLDLTIEARGRTADINIKRNMIDGMKKEKAETEEKQEIEENKNLRSILVGMLNEDLRKLEESKYQLSLCK